MQGLLYTMHCLGPGFWCARTVLIDSLSDRRSDERCEGAGKTACELLYSQSRVGVVGSQLFRAAENTETGFTNFILYNSLAIIYQRGCMSGLVGFPSIWVSPPVCLFGQFQFDLRFWLKMLSRRRL